MTGFRSISHALFRGLELYGVFTRQGVGLVIPFIDATGVAADGITGRSAGLLRQVLLQLRRRRPGRSGARVREITSAPAAGPGDALRDVLGGFGALGPARGPRRSGASCPPPGSGSEEQLGGTTLVPGYETFRTARMVKSAEEVRRLERAALIAEDGIAAILGMLKAGRHRARGRHRVYEQEVLRKGAQPFFTVVTIGERAALADVYAVRARARARATWSASTSAACTRAIAPTSRARRCSASPRDKQRALLRRGSWPARCAAIAAMKPGVPVSQIFEIAMRVTRENGHAALPAAPRRPRHRARALRPAHDQRRRPTPRWSPAWSSAWRRPTTSTAGAASRSRTPSRSPPAASRTLTRSSQDLAIIG